ncbi:hypothetical protein V8D89_003047 [Ganoderma adspersum]
MGAVISSVANAFMLLVNGVAGLLQAIIGAIAVVLFGIANVLTCGRAGGPTLTTTGTAAGPVGGGMPTETTTGRRRFGFRRRGLGGAVAPTGGVGSVPLSDAGYYPAAGNVAPGVVGNGMTMGSGAYPGPAGAGLGPGAGAGAGVDLGAGTMYGPGGPGPTPYARDERPPQCRCTVDAVAGVRKNFVPLLVVSSLGLSGPVHGGSKRRSAELSGSSDLWPWTTED